MTCYVVTWTDSDGDILECVGCPDYSSSVQQAIKMAELNGFEPDIKQQQTLKECGRIQIRSIARHYVLQITGISPPN